MEEVGNFCKWDDCVGGPSTLREELMQGKSQLLWEYDGKYYMLSLV